MANIKKAINHIYNQTKDCTQKEAELIVSQFLNSYELQIRYGAKDKIEAFLNSIFTPSVKVDTKKELEIKEQTKLNKYTKYRTANRWEELIVKFRKNGMSDQNIASLLNKEYVHKKGYFNKVYIFRYRREKGIL